MVFLYMRMCKEECMKDRTNPEEHGIEVTQFYVDFGTECYSMTQQQQI